MIASTATILALAGTVALGPLSPASDGVDSREIDVLTPSDSVEMVVTGLSCPFCAFGLEKKLKSFDGIGEITVEAATGKVRFDLAEDHELTEDKLRGLVKDGGFEIVEIRQAPWIPDPGGGPS